MSLLGAELRLAGRLDARFFALLEALQATGSLHRAARAAGYSYRGAWLVMEAATNLTRAPLLHTRTGGNGGGGSSLSETALALLQAWRRLQGAKQQFLAEQERLLLAEQPELAGLLRRLSMKTSARNQFAGRIHALRRGPASTLVTLDLGDGLALRAALSSEAAEALALHEGQEAVALVKASEVVLVGDFAGYRLGASNQLAGSVSRVHKGAVSSLVVLTLPGGRSVTASVTHDAVEALGLAVGTPVTAVFKAAAVMLAVDAAEADAAPQSLKSAAPARPAARSRSAAARAAGPAPRR